MGKDRRGTGTGRIGEERGEEWGEDRGEGGGEGVDTGGRWVRWGSRGREGFLDREEGSNPVGREVSPQFRGTRDFRMLGDRSKGVFSLSISRAGRPQKSPGLIGTRKPVPDL